jgi:Fe-S cluster assembly protein SufD
MTQVAEKLQPWIAAIEDRPQGGPRWLQEARDKAAARFAALGFPTVREEEWRFTNVAPIASKEFRTAGPVAVSMDQIDSLPYGQSPYRLVLVNGRFSAELSRLHDLPHGVRAGSLAAAATGHEDVIARSYAQAADYHSRAFVALNTALAGDGAYLYIPDGAIVEAPIEIMYVTAGDAAAFEMVQGRALIVAGERSQSRIVETWVSLRGGTYFTNAVTEVFAGQSAVVDHYKVQQEGLDAFHIATMQITAQRSSNVSSHSFSLGGKLVRNDVGALLDGEGAEVTLNGLYLADGDRLVDNHTTIDHAQAHCPSHEVYKGILAGRARAVFNGKIFVRPDAQKTDAKQTNKALLLTDEAQVNTKPQLEIFADDVRCTHGAAIGQLDEDALFYLKARGIPALDARNMLIHAFAGDVLNGIRSEHARRTTMRLVEQMLGLLH